MGPHDTASFTGRWIGVVRHDGYLKLDRRKNWLSVAREVVADVAMSHEAFSGCDVKEEGEKRKERKKERDWQKWEEKKKG